MSAHEVSVVAADLVASGTQVSARAEEVMGVHTATASWIESSLPFLPAAAAAALAAKAAEWHASTLALTSRMDRHAEALHASAAGYVQVDEGNAGAIAAVTEDPARLA